MFTDVRRFSSDNVDVADGAMVRAPTRNRGVPGSNPRPRCCLSGRLLNWKVSLLPEYWKKTCIYYRKACENVWEIAEIWESIGKYASLKVSLSPPGSPDVNKVFLSC